MTRADRKPLRLFFTVVTLGLIPVVIPESRYAFAIFGAVSLGAVLHLIVEGL